MECKSSIWIRDSLTVVPIKFRVARVHTCSYSLATGCSGHYVSTDLISVDTRAVLSVD